MGNSDKCLEAFKSGLISVDEYRALTGEVIQYGPNTYVPVAYSEEGILWLVIENAPPIPQPPKSRNRIQNLFD